MDATPHDRYVKELAAAGDWAALARYWIAHQHEPALAAAVACARTRATTDPRWPPLLTFLKAVQAEPWDLQRELPKGLLDLGTPAERATLGVLYLYPRAALCELAGQFPVEQQDRLFRLGLEAADQAAQRALGCADNALGALFTRMLASGQHEVRQWETAATAYGQALALYRELVRQRPEVYRSFMAMTLNNLGNVQRDLNHFEAARTSQLEALAIRRELARQRPELFRPQVAMTLNNLGNVQRALNDLGAARVSYEESLVIRRELARQRPEVFRPQVAMTLNNLGTVQSALNDLEAARASFEEGLGLYRELARQRPEVCRPQVAAMLNNLGAVQSDLNDLEAARASYEEALAIRCELARQRPEVYRADVATTLNNLGNVESVLNDLEAARARYEEALAIRRELARQRPEVYRADVAMTLNNLGGVQRALNDLEAARASHLEALAIRRELGRQRPEVYRPDLALTLNNLGNVESVLNDLEAARASFEEALAIRRELARQRPEVYRADVALTLNSLGTVQRALNDLEAAHASFEEALAIRRELARQRPEVYRPQVAMTLNNLGTAQRALNDLEAARASFGEGLGLYRELARQRPEVYRPQVATTLNNLGIIQSDLNDPEAARASYEEGLTIQRELARQRPEVHRADVALTLNNLGTVQGALNDPEAARASFEEGLAIRRDLAQQRPETYRADVALTLTNLGTVQLALNDLEAARGSYEQAAWLFEQDAEAQRRAGGTGDARLVERQRNHANLALLVRRENVRLGWPDYTAAHEHLCAATRCADRFRGKFVSETERRRMSKESFGLFELHVRNCVDLWEASVRDGVPRREVLHEAVWAAEASRSRALVDRLAANNPNAESLSSDFAARTGMTAQSFQAIAGLVPTDRPTAFVQFALGREQSVALVLTAGGGVVPVRLPDLDAPTAWKLADDWRQAYSDARSRHRYVCDWDAALTRLLAEVSRRALAPVLAVLPPDVKRLVVSPHQALHLFPLHACPLPGGGGLLADRFDEITCTPSFSLLHACRARRSAGNAELVLFENAVRGLIFSQAEGAALRRRFAEAGTVRSFAGAAATRDQFLAATPDARVVHYSGHAAFDGANPLASPLELHGAPLELRDLFAGRVRLPGNELTILNGCETGLHLPAVTDDVHSFTTGFLFAGARCVVSTLWAIPDLSSALLMDRFYADWLAGASPAAALHDAQDWLRKLTGDGLIAAVEELVTSLPDDQQADVCRGLAQELAAESPAAPLASPVHWAAFTASGWAHARE